MAECGDHRIARRKLTNGIPPGQLAGLAAAGLFGCSAPVVSTLTGAGSALSIAGRLYGGATLALLAVRLLKGTEAETAVNRQDLPALGALTLLGGVVGPVALVLGLARLPAASSSLLLYLEAGFTLAIAVLLPEGSLSGATAGGSALIALATLAWGIDNNLSQRLSLRDPIQIATFKTAGASLPMLTLALLAIGAYGYGLSIWLDLLVLRDLGAAREAVLFATAPFVGALFSVLVLRDAATPPLLVAAALMAVGVVVLLREQHSHWQRHELLDHAPHVSDAHHRHRH